MFAFECKTLSFFSMAMQQDLWTHEKKKQQIPWKMAVISTNHPTDPTEFHTPWFHHLYEAGNVAFESMVSLNGREKENSFDDHIHQGWFVSDPTLPARIRWC